MRVLKAMLLVSASLFLVSVSWAILTGHFSTVAPAEAQTTIPFVGMFMDSSARDIVFAIMESGDVYRSTFDGSNRLADQRYIGNMTTGTVARELGSVGGLKSTYQPDGQQGRPPMTRLIETTPPLPRLLLKAIRTGRWKHPGDEQLLSVIPWLQGLVEFLCTQAQFDGGIKLLRQIYCDRLLSDRCRVYSGESLGHDRDLPWLDADLAVYFTDCRKIGDDVSLALDYRTHMADPRVVANYWSSRGNEWRFVTDTFSAFARAIGIVDGGR